MAENNNAVQGVGRARDRNCPSEKDLIGNHGVRTGNQEPKKGTRGHILQWPRLNDTEGSKGHVFWDIMGWIGMARQRRQRGECRDGVFSSG